jgi:KUP system potassium uptake protein
VLNYAGQAALVLNGASITDNIFYQLCPSVLLPWFILLATVATIIASQSIITGAFSMTRQAIRLGWLPRLQITQTSSEAYGQIYVGAVNWLLMLATLGLAVGFGKSDNLASAYGIAVSMTMLMTSVLLFIAMREVLDWSLPLAAAVAAVFVLVDSGFFAANFIKVAEGGYVPLLLAGLVYGIMVIWHLGSEAVAARLQEAVCPIGHFLATLADEAIARVPGTAVFLTRAESDVPPIMLWHVRHNRALHSKLFVLSVNVASVPRVAADDRLKVREPAPDFWRGIALYGFMERPDIPALLHEAHERHGCAIDLADVTYYIGHETILPAEDRRGLPRSVEALYALMQRNSTRLVEYFRLPTDAVVELGREIPI